MSLRHTLLLSARDYLRGGSLCVYDGSGHLLSESRIADMEPTEGDRLRISCETSTILQSGYASSAALKDQGGASVQDLSVGEGDAEVDLLFDSLAFVQGDRVAISLLGV